MLHERCIGTGSALQSLFMMTLGAGMILWSVVVMKMPPVMSSDRVVADVVTLFVITITVSRKALFSCCWIAP